MLDSRGPKDIRDAFLAFFTVGAIFVGIFAITHVYPFNNALSLAVLSGIVLVGAIWIRLAL